MELFDTTQTGLERALAGSSLRQQAIAQNIANVNTPGYRRQDVDFASALSSAWDDGKSAVESVNPTMQTDATSVVRADGSSVDIDVEAGAQAKNGLTYQTLSAVLKTRSDILQIAMGVK